ncbi:MAG: hypothetical protein M1834_004361 [Cirrosporium novae-zelandiae]|nr:MAG: hypothetical protein M1834_004361 [Cirrosporium novae-zelandiae]
MKFNTGILLLLLTVVLLNLAQNGEALGLNPMDVNMKSFFTVLTVAILSFAPGSDAFWRLECRGRLGVERMDPIMSPGVLSSHAHAIHGGSNFGLSADATSLLRSNCTSCGVTQDKSAYWVPTLYFESYVNNTFELVNQNGGMLAYYKMVNSNITAFPQNFRMIAGDNFQRNFTLPIPDPPKTDWVLYPKQETQKSLGQKALGFNCLNYLDPSKTEASLYRHFMPSKEFLDANCPSGLRLELMFPSCWNGVDLDSDDHKSHVAYPNLLDSGTCPDGYPVQLPGLFYETIWDTENYEGMDGRFVLSNGDPTGYGYHGDFIAAWESGVLTAAIEQCNAGDSSGEQSDCPVFDVQTEDTDRSCHMDIPQLCKEDVTTGTMTSLPGNVQIQEGPAYATEGSSSGSVTFSSSTSVETATVSYYTTSNAAVASATSATVPVLSVSPAGTSTTDELAPVVPTTTVLSVNAKVVASSTITSAPVETSGTLEVIGTTTYTSAGVEVDLVVVEEDVYTTVEVVVPVRHRHRLRHHGGRL